MNPQSKTPDICRCDGESRDYWCSVEQRASSPEEIDFTAEFPGYDPRGMLDLSRRGFLKIMGASLALAGLTLTACRRWPEQEVHPFAHQPEGTLPGVAEYYATMLELAGVATGVVVKTADGRPIKVEGNALHPFSLGAADAFAQASVLSLYDPERGGKLVERAHGTATPRTWQQFEAFARPHFAAIKARRGDGLAVLAPPTASPTLARLKAAFTDAFPLARWHHYEPIHADYAAEGARLAFGKSLRPQYRLDQARIIACFDADLLGMHPAHQRHAHDWAVHRRSADQGRMNRLYAVEANFSITGGAADERLPARPTRIGELLHTLATRLGVVEAPALDVSAEESAFVDRLADDLQAHRGASLVAVGIAQPPHVHALAHAVNHALGNHGQTVAFTGEPAGNDTGCVASLRDLSLALEAGQVRTLLILGGNPVYDAPADLSLLPRELDPAVTSIHLSLEDNETSARCTWRVPMAHSFECWGDGRAWDGTYSVQQPLILPLFDGRSSAELLALVMDEPAQDGLSLVRATAAELAGTLDAPAAWRGILHDGMLANSAWPTVDPGVPRLLNWPASAPLRPGTFELQFIPDARMYDGRFANNGWLQELPDPMTRLTWDNAALLSKADADTLGVTTGDVISIEAGTGSGAARKLDIAAYILPGAAPGAIVLPLGYGRTRAGNVGNHTGFNAYRLRTAAATFIATGAQVARTGRSYVLASVQDHHLIDAVGTWGREKRVGRQGESGYLIREASLDDYRNDRRVFHRNAHGNLSLELFNAPSAFNEPHAWGMAIDLNSCTGCAACVLACQAENNIPIVGKRQVERRREMHWLRIDRYFKGPIERPDTVHAPLACGHCETAPCEQVCPVAATVHDSEGLNVMVYNRCIGTRYCSNNCPFKVRRFNYFDYHATDPRGRPQPWLGAPDTQPDVIDDIRRMLFNPDVTVRMRGVMEKCTYCTQRIQAARIAAKNARARGERDDERVRDGDVTPACAQACPTQAIVFGDLNDPNSRVSTLLRSHRTYSMLEELNLRPRTRYLARVRNRGS